MSVEEIREAKDELKLINESPTHCEFVGVSSTDQIQDLECHLNDKKRREIYEMRSKILKDKVSALNEAERRGIEQGRREGKEQRNIEIAKNLLDILDDETIALKTGLDIKKVKKLRSEI